jgi:hypothetical protein
MFCDLLGLIRERDRYLRSLRSFSWCEGRPPYVPIFLHLPQRSATKYTSNETPKKAYVDIDRVLIKHVTDLTAQDKVRPEEQMIQGIQ